jgi:hypothetical protein
MDNCKDWENPEKMSNFQINFILNNEEKLICDTYAQLNSLHCCSLGSIFFKGKDTSYLVADANIEDMLEHFVKMFKNALSNKLGLHESIKLDIGYLWNEARQDKPGLFYPEEGLWVGWLVNHLWFSGKPDFLDSWLYSDHEGNIIFEITPSYPWFYYDADEHPEKQPNYVPYEEWIKNYKPLVIKKIPRDVAEKWIEQADYIVKKIDENMAREREGSVK